MLAEREPTNSTDDDKSEGDVAKSNETDVCDEKLSIDSDSIPPLVPAKFAN